jgi:hypothetical protein
MALFPSTPAPIDPVTIKPRWNTIITGFDAASEQRIQKWSFPKFDVELTYELVTPIALMKNIWDFFIARKGCAEAFHYYFRHVKTFTDLFVYRADGETSLFDIPGQNTSSQSIYVDGVLQESGYTILYNSGDSNSDQVSFTVAPSDGALITCDFTGFLRNRCRFGEDFISEKRFYTTCFSTGLTLKGLSFEL